MKRNILCILIALMVLSLSALLIARPPWFIFDGFYSTLNGSSIHVTLATDGREPLTTLDLKELRDNWADHDGKFVRFTGVVGFVDTDFRTEQLRKLHLQGYPYVYVYPLDAPGLPETYQRGELYEFTGFLVRYEKHTPNQQNGLPILRVYAVDIQFRHGVHTRPRNEKENKK